MPSTPATVSVRPLRGTVLALAWLAGVALQLQQADLWSASLYLGWLLLGGVGLVLAGWHRSAERLGPWVALGLLALSCLLLGAASTGWRAARFASTALPPALEGRDFDVVGVVSGMPQSQAAGLRFRLQLESARSQGEAVDLPALMDVGWYHGWGGTAGGGLELQRLPQALRPGERWQMRLRVKAPHGNVNPHGFDYELYLWEQGVQASAYVRAGVADPAPVRLEEAPWLSVDGARFAVRERIQAAVAERSAAALISALVVGDQAAIERSDWDVYRATGIAHLVSISGLHVTLFAWLAARVLGWLWRRSSKACLVVPAPTVALWGGVALAWAYALFAGWGVPAQRTVLMLAVVAGVRSTGGRWPWPLVWLAACLAVVLWDPWALMQAGFWLSFVAVGVLFATDSGAAKANSTRAMDRFRSMLREQWVIGLALAPLAVVLFGQVSVVGLLANLLAVPWVTLVLTPLSFLGLLHPLAWDAAALAAQALHAVLQPMAQWPLAVWWWPRPPLGIGLLACVGAMVAVFPWSWRMRVQALPLVLPLLLWRPAVPEAGAFSLLAADVGQGNAVLVRTAHHALVFDAGPRYGLESDAGHRVMVPLLQTLQWQPDLLVLSHRDTDHVGGAQALLDMVPGMQLLSSLEPAHPLLAQRAHQRCEAGQHWEWDGVAFTVLHPTAAEYVQQGRLKPNALSCVLHIRAGSHSALLAGDIEAEQERALVQRSGADLHADVLLVPHHGSKTSSTEALLDAVQPRFAWVQAGYRNRFGHPAAPVSARYVERGIVLADSPHCGAMHWVSTAPDTMGCERDRQRRYWHHRAP
ncbi:ComEC/Rec2 family competence protein [Curvibacter sp. APW13]|uniref:ComEC/Rec2 family competence protein n=1 Tax=Curvibacter sp. APW13 TaxID=3077236 RepID=UPI0028DF9E7A|nr:ComEC/Rec2 family competence protein [Curvibacter sp. APW13]MDT8992030.1 ComEC/Rec2 family competence protein [Curvibacter sp. APW13]